MTPTQTQEENRVTAVRLNAEVFDKFAKQFRLLHPTSSTTALEAGYALGVQAVLDALRRDIVV